MKTLELPGVMDDDGNDKLRKTKKKIKKDRKKSGSSGGSSSSAMPLFPTSIVCSSYDAIHTPGTIELGLLVIGLIFFLYFYGCYETFLSLPDVPRIPRFNKHMGENFNLAINDFDTGGHRRKHTKKKKKKPKLEGAAAAAAAGATGADGKVQRLEKKDDKKSVNKKQKKGGGGKNRKGVKMITDVDIPKAIWPVKQLIDEQKEGQYEDLIHPGDMKTIMKVPKFWSPPIHDGGLMSRETAMKIGTCAKPDPADPNNFQRGDACPHDQRTILIMIASYRDYQCRDTVTSAFAAAQHPERVRIAVVDQLDLRPGSQDTRCDLPYVPCELDLNQPLCKYAKQLDVYETEASLSVGPVFARHIGYRMYRGEYYATQSDAHVTFTQNWDVDIIQQIESTHNEMAVLSTYLTDIQGSIDANGHSLRKTRPIMCNTGWEGGPQGLHLRHGSQPERFPSIHGQPQLSPWWAAGYSFSRGHFVVNVPYDYLQPMIFQGEEMSIGIRGFTIGYDFYAPERSVCFHHYAEGKNAFKRNKVPHFWENDNLYLGTGERAMKRLLGIVHMNPEVPLDQWDHKDEDIYGIGNVRTPEKFYALYGIDVKKKTSEGNLCNFVDEGRGLMHQQFTPFLRKDGMGIDYKNIHFTWRDPAKPIIKELKDKEDKEMEEEANGAGDDFVSASDGDNEEEEKKDSGDDTLDEQLADAKGLKFFGEGGDEDDDMEEEQEDEDEDEDEDAGDLGGDDPDLDDADIFAKKEVDAAAGD